MATDPQTPETPSRERLDGGRYEVRGTLGTGAQAETLVAWDTLRQCEVAIKRFRVRGASSWKEVELAEREAQVLATLDHPQLPRYVAHFEAGGCLCLVMERIDGESLADLRARGGSLTEADVWALLADAAKVLAYLHGRVPPIIHRDIKPSNVIRRPDGSLVLVDFGSVAYRLRPSGGSTVAGTFGYMAPEQLLGQAFPATDVYALATTLVAAFSGCEPETLPRRGLEIDVRAALHGRASRKLVSALEPMLSHDPGRRAASIEEALARPASRSRRHKAALLGVAGLLSGALALWWAAPNPGRLTTFVASSRAAVPTRDCDGEVERALELGDPWRARELLQRCDSPEQLARAALFLGDFAAASSAFEGARAAGTGLSTSAVEVEAHLFAGRNILARDAARRVSETRFREVSADLERGLLCVEGALGRRAGLQDSIELLSRIVAITPRSSACRLLGNAFALLVEYAPDAPKPDLRPYLLERYGGPLREEAETWPLWQQAVPDGAAKPALIDPQHRIRFAPIGLLERAITHRRIYAPDGYVQDAFPGIYDARLATDLALFYAFMGERTLAATTLATVDELAALGPARHREDVYTAALDYAAAVAYLARDRPRVERYLAATKQSVVSEVIAELDRQSAPGTPYTAPSYDTWNTPLLESASTGDADAVVAALHRANSSGRQVLERIVPKITKNQDDLRHWLKYGFPLPCLSCGVVEIAINVADRREAARLLGDHDLEKRWAEVARRFTDAMTRHDGGAEWIALERAIAGR